MSVSLVLSSGERIMVTGISEALLRLLQNATMYIAVRDRDGSEYRPLKWVMSLLEKPSGIDERVLDLARRTLAHLEMLELNEVAAPVQGRRSAPPLSVLRTGKEASAFTVPTVSRVAGAAPPIFNGDKSDYEQMSVPSLWRESRTSAAAKVEPLRVNESDDFEIPAFLRKEQESTQTKKPLFLTQELINDASVPAVSGFIVPDKMRTGQSYRATYTIGVRGEVVGPNNEKPARMTPMMTARLEGAGFSIKSLSEQTKSMDAESENKWEWEVVPASTGKHSLHLIVTGYVEFGNTDAPKEFVSDTRQISVNVSVPRLVGKWGASLVVAAGTLAGVPPAIEIVRTWLSR